MAAVADAARPVVIARRPPRPAAVLSAWVSLVAVAVVWGRSAIGDRRLGLGAAPLVGTWLWHPRPGLLVAAAVALAVVVSGPRLAAAARWPALVAAAGVTASAWAVTLAAADGWDMVTAPLASRYEYEPLAATIGDPLAFVRTFTDALPGFPTHVKSHPPLATLVPWLLDRVGLDGAGWFAGVVVLAWGAAVGAALVACREVAGERAARRAAPALVMVPAAVWAATSVDALFAGVLAAGVALTVNARAWVRAAGGIALALGLLLTYGGVLLLALPAAVALHRRRPSALVAVVAGLGAVLAVAAVAGFWWPDGLAAAREAYWGGVAARRPSAYLALAGNPAALALATGPAVLAGLAALSPVRRPALALLPVAALVAVALADASLLSKGEVERIWLPFVPWLALAAPGDDRRWLALQASVGLGLQAGLVTPW